MLHDPLPHKLVWLRIGNCTQAQIVQLLTAHEQKIHALDVDLFEAVLILS